MGGVRPEWKLLARGGWKEAGWKRASCVADLGAYLAFSAWS